MKTLILTIVAALLFNTSPVKADYDSGMDKAIITAVNNMVDRENETAEDRYEYLHEDMVKELSEQLEKVEGFEFTDADCEDIEEAAAEYISDLREREQL